jgi:hypothetical protein
MNRPPRWHHCPRPYCPQSRTNHRWPRPHRGRSRSRCPRRCRWGPRPIPAGVEAHVRRRIIQHDRRPIDRRLCVGRRPAIFSRCAVVGDDRTVGRGVSDDVSRLALTPAIVDGSFGQTADVEQGFAAGEAHNHKSARDPRERPVHGQAAHATSSPAPRSRPHWAPPPARREARCSMYGSHAQTEGDPLRQRARRPRRPTRHPTRGRRS